MLAIILTWVGAILGIIVLLAMAFGAFALDLDEARRGQQRKRKRKRNGSENSVPTEMMP